MAVIDGTAAADTIEGTPEQDVISGLAGDDALFGGGGADVLYGGQGGDELFAGFDSELQPDTLFGDDGDDRLSGGEGADALFGGAGDDLVELVAATEGTGLVVDGGVGHDSLHVQDRDLSSFAITGIEALYTHWRIVGTAAQFQQFTLIGTIFPHDAVWLCLNGGGMLDLAAALGSGDAVIEGTGGGMTVTTGEGDDTIFGTSGADGLFAGGGGDELYGGDGADSLDGGAGADTIFGGGGDDIVMADAADRIVEEPGGGQDRVITGESRTLEAHVEELVLTGEAPLAGRGNGEANRIAGNAGDNRLWGGAGTDTLWGGAGDDHLSGGAGADRLEGGVGDDTYAAEPGDVIIETAGAGIDTLFMSAHATLGPQVENLVLGGIGAWRGTGNGLANRITGNGQANSLVGLGGADSLAGGRGHDRLTGGTGHDSLAGDAGDDNLVGGSGNDILSGGPGNDRLAGGTGADRFIFDQRPGTGHADRIADFDPAADLLGLDRADFSGLVPGRLGPAAFVRNTSGLPEDRSDRIIYERDTGKLYFDRDGTGSAARVHFATIGTHLDLRHGDVFVF